MTLASKDQDIQTQPTPPEAPPGTAETDSPVTAMDWQDANSKNWQIVICADRITLTSNDETYEIKQAFWTRDIYVASHGDGYIIRFETESHSIGFIIEHDLAHPLLSHIGHTADAIVDLDIAIEDNASKTIDPLLWPKVSPLAIWALISSSMTFLPMIGIIPAIVTIILLAYHRARVRSSQAYRHSRTLCRVATIFLVTGLIVSMLGVLGMSSNSQQESSTVPVTIQSVSNNTHSPNHDTLPSAQHASILDTDHNWGLIIAALFVVLLSLTVHEAAHAITAWWMGDDFAKRLGRVTLNPASHIDPIGTVVLPLILFMSGVGVFGWAKPVPVRLDYVPRPRRAHILISLAGPASNLLLAAASMSLLIGIGCLIRMIAPDVQSPNYAELSFTETVTFSGFALAPVLGPLCTILKLSFIVNIFLAFFNLIPIPPLDGSWVLENLFPHSLGPIYDRIRPFSFILFLMLIYSNMLAMLLAPVFTILDIGFGLLAASTFWYSV